MGKPERAEPIKPVPYNELPPEFKKFDQPFGLEEHVFNIIVFGIMVHGSLIYTLFYLYPLGHTHGMAFLYWLSLGYATSFGTTVGAHRYWCHKTYKAKLPLQIILMLLQTGQVQYPLFKWCRDHRVHHKYTDTHADPHSAATGFWFSHILWGFQPRHPDNVKASKIIDISDLARDPVVRFQSKYYWELVFLLLGVEIAVCRLLFQEPMLQVIAGCLCQVGASLHGTFLVNSVAHAFGNKPYEKDFSASENKLVAIITLGEGFHNYHHTFPWDYKASEYGYYFNMSTFFIHVMGKIGWAYDMKTVSRKLLVDRINRTGNGTHPLHRRDKDQALETSDTSYSSCWGWGDNNLRKMDLNITETHYPFFNNNHKCE